jgi:hypothetical protein
MIRIVAITSLLAYAIVVSQPLAYIVFMSKAQRALSAPAYIELRQRINAVMSRRLGVIYVGTMATVLFLLVLSLRSRNWNALVAATVALLCLLVDIVLVVRENVPINGVIDRWSTTDYPEDWQDYRTKWFTVFGYRQVVLLLGFFSLVVGAVIP